MEQPTKSLHILTLINNKTSPKAIHIKIHFLHINLLTNIKHQTMVSASPPSSNVSALLIVLFMISTSTVACAGKFYEDFYLTWGQKNAKMLDYGQRLTLSLDQVTGSAFESYNQYLYVKIDMQIKLVAGNSAGTVTTFYVSMRRLAFVHQKHNNYIYASFYMYFF